MQARFLAVVPILGIGLVLSAFSGPSKDGLLDKYSGAYTAISLYLSDSDGIYPMATALHHSNKMKIPFPPETAVGWWDTPENKEVATSLWANAVLPYATDGAYLEIPGAPDFVSPGVAPPDGESIRRAGLVYNGLLQGYPQSSVVSLGLVPLLWPGLGVANLVSQAGVSPTLNCLTEQLTECKYKSTGIKGGMLYQMNPGVPWGEQDSDYSRLLLSDGSVRRVRVGQRALPADVSATGVYSIFTPPKEPVGEGAPVTYWQDGDFYPWHFRPDRTMDSSNGDGFGG